MKLDVIFATAMPEMPTISETLNDGKYRKESRCATMLLNCSFSAASDGKN